MLYRQKDDLDYGFHGVRNIGQAVGFPHRAGAILVLTKSKPNSVIFKTSKTVTSNFLLDLCGSLQCKINYFI